MNYFKNYIALALPGHLLIDAAMELRMGRQLGRGGFATVVQAEVLSPELRQRAGGSDQVAVKLLTGMALYFKAMSIVE